MKTYNEAIDTAIEVIKSILKKDGDGNNVIRICNGNKIIRTLESFNCVENYGFKEEDFT